MSDFPIIELELTLFQELTPYHCIYIKPKTRHCHQHPQLRLLWMLSLPYPLPHISIQSLQGEKWSDRTLSKKITYHLLFLWLVIFTYGGPESQLSLVLQYHPALGGWLHKFLNKIHKLCMLFCILKLCSFQSSDFGMILSDSNFWHFNYTYSLCFVMDSVNKS